MSEPCQGTKHCCPLREVEKTKKPVTVEHVHYDKDGNARNIEVNCYPILDSSGNVAQVIEYCLDITQRKRAEEQIKASLKEKDLLLKEVHHRVKNNLQVISSMLNLQSRKITDQQNLEPFRESQNRIRSMAFIHERLYQSEDLSKVNFKRYLETLATYLLQSYEVNQDSIRLYSEVENVQLDISRSIACGLLINELVSNSLKYAFTESQKGEIRIGLKRVGENQYKLVVSDDGIGLPEELDFRNTNSLGLQLVNTLTNQLQGGIEVVRNNGTTFKITFPGPDQAGQR
jgi:two-component sensor histidine kinase